MYIEPRVDEEPLYKERLYPRRSPTRIKTGDLTTSSRAATIGRTEVTGTGGKLTALDSL